MTKQTEIRTAPAMPVEFRAAAEGDKGIGTMRGYAAVYGKLSQNLGGFVEQVDPAAFRKSLADNVPVMARYNHEHLIGTTEAETLRLFTDDTGLGYEVDLPDTSVGRDIAALAERGDLRYSSFAFQTIEDEWDVTEQGFPLRTLRAVRLVDVAPVDDPAYRDTSVAMRSLASRVGIEDAANLTPEQVREALHSQTPAPKADEAEPEGQRETHPSLDVLMKRLDLEARL